MTKNQHLDCCLQSQEYTDKAGQRFTGRVYRDAPITGFLDNLKGTMAIQYYLRDSIVHIK